MLQGLQPCSWAIILISCLVLGPELLLVFGWCSSVCHQGLLPSPPCLSWLSWMLWGCTHPCGHRIPAPRPTARWPSMSPCQWDQTFWALSWAPGRETFPLPLLAPRVQLCIQSFPCLTPPPTLPRPLRNGQWFVHSMELMLPACTKGTASISLSQHHSLLALRKGFKLDLESVAACDWVTNLYNGGMLRRDGCGWRARSAWSRG